MTRKRIIWMVVSGALMTAFFLVACMTTTMDAAGHIHASYFWMAGFIIFAIVHVYCTCMSK